MLSVGSDDVRRLATVLRVRNDRRMNLLR
jgi:hypothetical protein